MRKSGQLGGQSSELGSQTVFKHPSTVANYDGSLRELADEISELQYESLSMFLLFLASKLSKDALVDLGKGRTKLGYMLEELSQCIHKGSRLAMSTWEICKPFMRGEMLEEEIQSNKGLT